MRLLKRNKGLWHSRVNYDYKDGYPNPEKVFQKLWNEENTPDANVGYGNGMLQDLMCCDARIAKTFEGSKQDKITYTDYRFTPLLKNGNMTVVYKITPREHAIVATIIQWLGSHIGMAFLKRCLKEAGYEIVVRKKKGNK